MGLSRVARIANALLNRFRKPEEFVSSAEYWERRYKTGGNSGVGSFGRLAKFKAEVLNGFVDECLVCSVVELGCGDGSQLELASYPGYTGIDVSEAAVKMCSKKFANDKTKKFLHLSEINPGTALADLAISIDVIYHLVEDDVYRSYMDQLFSLSHRYVCVYSSNFDGPGPIHAPHVRHRRFTDWIAVNAPQWKLIRTVANAFPYDPKFPSNTSWADFFFFSRLDEKAQP